jgi:hypothetical protein
MNRPCMLVLPFSFIGHEFRKANKYCRPDEIHLNKSPFAVLPPVVRAYFDFHPTLSDLPCGRTDPLLSTR